MISMWHRATFLDTLLEIPLVAREYYGDDLSIKPNDHCNWIEYDVFPGWHETDKHLLERMKERMGHTLEPQDAKEQP